MARLRDRLREEDGFSLTELLAAMSVGAIVLWALMTIFVNGVQGSLRVTDRVEASQSARLAMDRIVTVFDSQTCLGSGLPPLVDGTSNQATVLADLGDATFTPRQYRFTYDPVARTITEQIWNGTGTPPSTTYTGTPNQTRVLVSNVVPIQVAGVDQPIFRYFKYTNTGTLDTETDTPLTVPVSATDRMLSVRIAAQFTVIPSRTGTRAARSSSVHGEGSVASADATDPLNGARCL
jgi:prepilin-type N-terminal cleavage/methylation domain-containing protein